MSFNNISYGIFTQPQGQNGLFKKAKQVLLRQPDVIPVESQAKKNLMGVNLSADIVDLFTSSVPSSSAVFNIPNVASSPGQNRADEMIHLLNDNEQQRLSRLPRSYQNYILTYNIDPNSQQLYITRKQMEENTKTVIQKLGGDAKIAFAEKDNGHWRLQTLLDLANAVHKLPIAHRKQLDGITFVRDDYPDEKLPPGFNPHLFEKMALSAIAGHYNPQEKAVVLFDQGEREQLAVLNKELKSSLRQLKNRKKNPEVEALQKMLNPYLEGLGYPRIKEDGIYGSQTEKAVRTAESVALSRYIKKNWLISPTQREGMEQLISEIREGRYTGGEQGAERLKTSLEGLNILPTSDMEQLLQEMANSESGEAFLRFFLTDLANSFRTTGRVTRTEEVFIHEIGHHFQLGLENEAFYIEEFSKLSGWYETSDNSVADGYLGYIQAGESLEDVYNNLASGGKIDEGEYKHHDHTGFVTPYAHTDPMEDFAESYKTFILEPENLLKVAPEKFFFLNSLPTIQNRHLGTGRQEKSHYLAEDIRVLTSLALQTKYKQTNITNEQVDAYIRQAFEKITQRQKDGVLNSDTIYSIYDTHAHLLRTIGVNYLPSSQPKPQVGNQDDSAIWTIYDKTRQLISRNLWSVYEAHQFFQHIRDPQEARQLLGEDVWDGMSNELKQYMTDPQFSSMILALGKISGYAYTVNAALVQDGKDVRAYKEASQYFSNLTNEPTSIFSRQLFSHAYNSTRSVFSRLYNPEARQIDKAMDFFAELKASPEKALAEFWNDLPTEFQEQLHNERFVNSISGAHGRYVPSPDVIKSVIRNTVSVVEFRRSLELLDADTAADNRRAGRM